MEKRKIEPVYADNRGYIADVLYKHPVDHVGIIDTVAKSIRGNHYHKLSTQHILVTKGSLEYWYKPLGSPEPAKCVLVREYEMVTTPPEEVHALRMLEANQFIVLSEGLRGGVDYEQDTFRTEPIIPSELHFETKNG
jgi:quercetin dioxygenase-like cupin family protein